MTAPHRLLDSVTKGDTLILTVLQPQIEGDQVASALKAELLNLVETSGLKKVILDLKNTRYVSSIAFWPLLALRKQLSQASGGRIIICGLHGAVEE
ncbi:MAG: STAS domain-containing protein, partial [Gemmataceae bacterium]